MSKKSKNPNSAPSRRKRIRLHNLTLYIISATLIICGVIIILRDTTYDPNARKHPPMATFPPNDTIDIDGNWAVQTASPHETVLPTQEPEAHRPVYVHFPQYNINCPVDPVGVTEDGVMATVPAHDRAGWLETSGTPTTGGNVIIAGHNRYHGNLGYFSVIRTDAKVGDQVMVEMDNGEYAFYLIESIQTFKYNEVPDEIMSVYGEPRLTLITCLGDYDYNLMMSRSRVIAVCKPVNVAPNTHGGSEPTK